MKEDGGSKTFRAITNCTNFFGDFLNSPPYPPPHLTPQSHWTVFNTRTKPHWNTSRSCQLSSWSLGITYPMVHLLHAARSITNKAEAPPTASSLLSGSAEPAAQTPKPHSCSTPHPATPTPYGPLGFAWGPVGLLMSPSSRMSEGRNLPSPPVPQTLWAPLFPSGPSSVGKDLGDHNESGIRDFWLMP